MADKALEVDGARPMRPLRAKRLSAANEALEANGARPMRPLRLKRPSLADEAIESDEASAADEALECRRPPILRTVQEYFWRA